MNDTMFWAMALKGFVALAFFFVAYLISRGLARVIPNGRIKDVLFDRTIQQQHPWKFALLGLVTIWGVIVLVFLVLGLTK